VLTVIATDTAGLCDGWASTTFPCTLPKAAAAAVSAVHTTVSVAHGAAAAGSFMAHPFEHMNRALQKAASGLVTDVLPGLEKVTRPDLSRAWFAHAYAGAFAIALLAFVVLVGWNFVQRARGRIGSDELAESLFLYGPLFLAGAVFGPAAGAFLLRFTGALTDSVTSFFGTSGSPTGSTSRLQEIIAAATPTGITGGAVVGVLFLLALVLALVMVFMVLLVMSVTLYLTGVIAPLSLVWLVHPHRRGRGLKVVNVWVGICFSHVLLFFLLGAVFSMFTDLPFTRTFAPGGAHTANAAATTAAPGGSPFAELVALAVAVIALFTAVLSPLGLLRFAPVAPTAAPPTGRAGAGGGAGRLPGARRGGAGSGRGPAGFADSAAGPVDGPGGGRRGGSDAGPVGGGLAPSYAAYRRGPSSTGAGTSGGTAAGSSSAGTAAGAAGRAGVAGGLAAAAGPVGAAVAVAVKGARKARAAGEAAAAHMGHAEGGHGAGEGLAPRHHR
jgi:hypothetical protein